MITREEAKKINLVTLGDTYKVHTLIDKIYNEIGACGTCEHYNNLGNRYNKCKFLMLDVETDFYCTDYKGEPDDN